MNDTKSEKIVRNSIPDISEYKKLMPISPLRDSRLSYRARGVLAHLMSMSNRWKIMPSHLKIVLKDDTCKSGRLGKDAIQKVMCELKTHGYVSQTKRRLKDGRWYWETQLKVEPAKETNSSNEHSAAGRTISGKISNKRVNNSKLLENKDSKPLQEDSSAVDEELDYSYPSIKIHKETIEDVLRLYGDKFSTKTKQEIIDEVSAVLDDIKNGKRTDIVSLSSWVTAICWFALKGEFIPEHCKRIERWRKHKSDQRNRNHGMHQEKAEGRKPTKDEGREQMQKIKDKIGMRTK